MKEVVEHVIQTMRQNLGEQLTVDDMARAAMFSKFHFSRVFHRVTGVSPGRFLSAMRLNEAKRLLMETPLTVADISHRVGYTSVGTFTSRFTASVGMSPTTFRRLRGFSALTQVENEWMAGTCTAGIRCDIRAPRHEDLGPVFVGVFPDRIPEGRPISCNILDRAGSCELENVPNGIWYVLAVASPRSDALSCWPPMNGAAPLVGMGGPVSIDPVTSLTHVDITLVEMQTIDPPILLALIDIQSALAAAASGRVGLLGGVGR
ncbi:AraC family transcriptional regulator [Solwaraspora sp. WMMD1047]|uniref:helix-turn-helix domain-containing protein n=1 Tax=Solwaraspora sp. WMMD1047 TaxID=3016102 RepID=UPI002417A994|nr:AraC family transcriptional regulator [Solwaraspora sp. WMMD1047]MDG4829919.1 AraC family transcriptional regulator [Solwaraspora sp. WMMD1047]